MRLDIKTTNLSLTPSLKIFIEEKILSLDKFLLDFNRQTDIPVWVEIGKTTQHHKKGQIFRAEAGIKLPKKLLYASAELPELHLAITELRSCLQQQINSYKSHLKKNIHKIRGAEKIK